MVCGDPRSDSVGDVVTPVSDTHHDGGEDLAIGPHVLNADVVAVGFSMDGAEEIGVVGDAVDGHAVQSEVLAPAPPLLRVGPGLGGDGTDETFVRRDVAGSDAAFFMRLFGLGESALLVCDLHADGGAIAALGLAGHDVDFCGDRAVAVLLASVDFTVRILVIVFDELGAFAGKVQRRILA